jgi:signal transduction histidine kinase
MRHREILTAANDGDVDTRVQHIEERVQATFESATEAVRRAHERSQLAVRRATEVREALHRARARRPEAWEAGRRTLAMLQLAAEEQARSVFEKDRFLAVASHELRQPLSAARAALEVLELSRTDAEAARARAVLRRQLAQMSRLVEDLLEISRYALQSSELTKSRLDFRRVVESAVETTSASIAAGGLTLAVALPSDPVWVDGDESRLLQVLTNLLANAVRYTPKDGRIALTVQLRGDLIVMEVADTGHGIDSADLERVFEPFARGHDAGQDGFGIGLALVRGIVERHGGSVAVVSDGPGRGSRFTVVLPACA